MRIACLGECTIEMAPAPEAHGLFRLGAAGDSFNTAVYLARLEGGGARPYISLVLGAADHDASPVLLLSDLADHSKNLKAHDILFDAGACAALAEAAILGHMNRDHGEALGLIAERLLGLPRPAPETGGTPGGDMGHSSRPTVKPFRSRRVLLSHGG